MSTWMSYERCRVDALRAERVYIQKKTFTNWANAFLEKEHLVIRDLFKDLADGKILWKLLEIISGENLGKPNRGILRVQKAENINKCLDFLRTRLPFENIGAEDIIDRNPHLTLGLMWNIILRFEIQEIKIKSDTEGESNEKRSAKDALLLWCQRNTAGYQDVHITNFTNSWRNGLGFNALLHAHRPDLIKYEQLVPTEHIGNLNNAFDVAKNDLGIAKLLDAEDIDQELPDEKGVITYVASFYHYFTKTKSEMTDGKITAKSQQTAGSSGGDSAKSESSECNAINEVSSECVPGKKRVEDTDTDNASDFVLNDPESGLHDEVCESVPGRRRGVGSGDAVDGRRRRQLDRK